MYRKERKKLKHIVKGQAIAMFKKAVITDEISQNFVEALELAKCYNLDAVEVRSVYELGPFEWTDEIVDRIKAEADAAGLPICCVSSPFFKCEIDDREEIARQYESLRKCVRHAKMLGTNLIRGFTFWAKGDYDQNLPKIVEYFKETVKILEEADMIMVLESESSVYAANATKLAAIIDAINSPYVKAVWDPGNSAYDPGGEVPYPAGYEIIKDKMVHMHLKDVKITDGKAKGAPVGKGDVDFEGHFRRLIEDGYRGYVSLETHYRPASLIPEDLLRLPKGSAFSEGGYEATEECLINWQEMMDRICK